GENEVVGGYLFDYNCSIFSTTVIMMPLNRLGCVVFDPTSSSDLGLPSLLFSLSRKDCKGRHFGSPRISSVFFDPISSGHPLSLPFSVVLPLSK
ncbi:hypothetical protein CCACVL1_00086, partial [Corchorus capsularis]